MGTVLHIGVLGTEDNLMGKQPSAVTAKVPSEANNVRKFRQWVGLLLAPVAWSIQLEAVYLLSNYGCSGNGFLWVHVSSVICLTLAIGGGLTALGLWRESGSQWPDSSGSAKQRRRFMAVLGILISALFSVVIIAKWLPLLVGVPCDK